MKKLFLIFALAFTGLTSCNKDNPKPIIVGEANDKIRFVATVLENNTDSSYLDMYGLDGNGFLSCDEFGLQYDNSWYYFAPEFPRLLIPESGTIIDTTFTFNSKKETPRFFKGTLAQTYWSSQSTLDYGHDMIRLQVYYNDKLEWDYIGQAQGSINIELNPQ